MKRTRLMALVTAVVVLLPAWLLAREIPAVVSTEWLEKNLADPKLVVIDIRKVEEFKKEHIPGARNAFFNSWVAKKGDLTNQLPEKDDLADLIAGLGIDAGSRVVVVGEADNTTEQSSNTRVAWTLKVAGVENVALLDGAWDKWAKEKRPASAEATPVKGVEFKPKWRDRILVDKGYVTAVVEKKNRSLADIRPPEMFFGVAKAPVVERAGHVPGAVNLPPDWVFTKEGTFKEKAEIEKIAAGVVGADRAKAITTYCNTGIYASLGWFVLSEMLGYSDVNLYDGSMQEWTKDPKAPLAAYTWK